MGRFNRYDVLCIGSATVDNFLEIDKKMSSVKIGDKVLVNSLEKHSGGGATNSAAALAKLGLKVKVLTKLGNDHDAELIIKEMRDYKTKNISLHPSKRNTDSSTIISSREEKDRIIFVHKGASQDLSEGDFRKRHLKAKWIYLATLMGKSFKTALKIVDHAKKKKMKLLFNPSLYLARRGGSYLKPILKETDLLVLNKKEAQTLLKISTNSMKTLLLGLKKLGSKTVVITNGAKKLFALHSENEGAFTYSLTPPNVKIVHTAGAGDSFTSGLLAGLIKGYPFADALRLGQVNSTSVIQNLGTKNKLLNESEAKRLMKRFRIPITKSQLKGADS